jgi:hypothetical protein
MALYDDLIAAIPDLTDEDFNPKHGSISLSDDGDGIAYISKWDYSKPIPKGMKLGK